MSDGRISDGDTGTGAVPVRSTLFVSAPSQILAPFALELSLAAGPLLINLLCSGSVTDFGPAFATAGE